MRKKLLILGGYGNAGQLIASHLLKETDDVEIVIAGRNLMLATEQAKKQNEEHNTDRVVGLQVDATSEESLNKALKNVDMVVVASSTTAFSKIVATAAIEAGVDYFDIQLSDSDKLETLKSLQSRIEDKGLCFVTDGGFHPGLPAAMIRYAAAQDNNSGIYKANVYSVIQMDWGQYEFSHTTEEEFITELLTYKTLVLENGEWIDKGWYDYRTFDFGAPFHERSCAPTYLEELRQLPNEIPTLQDCGMFNAGFDWFSDYVVLPIAVLALTIFKRAAAGFAGRILFWSWKHFSKPPFVSSLVLDSYGGKKENPIHIQMEISHEDGYELTAIPAVSALLQLLKDGQPRKVGLHYQATVVEPNKFFDDMKRMGIVVNVTRK